MSVSPRVVVVALERERERERGWGWWWWLAVSGGDAGRPDWPLRRRTLTPPSQPCRLETCQHREGRAEQSS